jgi:hypothetical protein
MSREEEDLRARAGKRAEWAWRALQAAASDLADAGEPRGRAELFRQEAERVAGLVDDLSGSTPARLPALRRASRDRIPASALPGPGFPPGALTASDLPRMP